MKAGTMRGFILLSLILSSAIFGQAAIKRGRNEGTMNIPASNAIGNGNITVYAGGLGSYGTVETFAEPTFGACVGLAGIMEITGKTSFTNFKGLGTSEARLQLTLPGNDRLRFLGFAFCGELYLTTTPDTLNAGAAAGKPTYGSFMLPSGILDLDWLAFFKTFPLKTYFSAGLADEPGLLYRYRQVSLKTGIEWKTHQHSAFLDIGAGLYKEKRSGHFAGDATYRQKIVWFEPGIRYRFFGAYSLLSSLRIAAYRALDRENDRRLPVSIVRFAAVMDIPLLFRETNTETIRTLVFMERTKDRKKDTISEAIEQGKRFDVNIDKELNSLELNSFAPAQEKDELRKREDIQKKLDDLEKLLDETP